MIVVHVALTAAEDYLTRRESHRRAHLERVQGLRAAGILIGGGPSPDGRTAELVYRLQQPAQVTHAIEEDPYWTGGVWTRYEPRSFAAFVEPWELGGDGKGDVMFKYTKAQTGWLHRKGYLSMLASSSEF